MTVIVNALFVSISGMVTVPPAFFSLQNTMTDSVFHNKLKRQEGMKNCPHRYIIADLNPISKTHLFYCQKVSGVGYSCSKE